MSIRKMMLMAAAENAKLPPPVFVGAVGANTTGTPPNIAGLQAGDFMLAISSIQGSAPSGWNLLTTLSNGYSGRIFWRMAAGATGNGSPVSDSPGGIVVAAYRMPAPISAVSFGDDATYEPTGVYAYLPAHAKRFRLALHVSRDPNQYTFVNGHRNDFQFVQTFFTTNICTVMNDSPVTLQKVSGATNYFMDTYSDGFIVGLE